MNWYIVYKEYVNYLHSVDNRAQHIEYNSRIKPYIGIVLEIQDFKYYVPNLKPDIRTEFVKSTNS